ncbi:MAG: hypothetical protein H7274_00800 [Rhodoferax sp.]|nr:hypothetical protein [Rhodoferax sp.]
MARPSTGGDEPNTYLYRLFADLLNRCIDKAQAGPSSDAYSRMAISSLVLAQLGFLAGHAALIEDLMHKLMKASAVAVALTTTAASTGLGTQVYVGIVQVQALYP